jgi:hypothetical protein
MPPQASGPQPADWLAALLRGLHPVRWLLCLVGLALTGLSAAVALSLFGHGPPDWLGWWEEPAEHAHALRAEILDRSLGGTLVRGGPLLALNAALWCLIGGWIVRHELLARRPRFSDMAEAPRGPGATAFVAGWWKKLVGSCLFALLFLFIMLVPVFIAGWLNGWFGSVGALAVSLLLPVVLVANLVVLVVALGVVAWPLMPATLAAECSDQFDALSRSYSYAFQVPVRYLLLTAAALALAALPLALVLYPLAEPLAAWEPEKRQAVHWLAAGLSVSIFWSVETLVYLHLRAAVDGVEADAVAAGRPTKAESPGKPPPGDAGPAGKPGAEGQAGPARKSGTWRQAVLALALLVGTWWLTFWLFTRASRGPTAWLGWGLGDTFVPPAEGLYKVASLIAGLWAALAVVVAVWLAIRRLVRGGAPRPGEQPPGERP